MEDNYTPSRGRVLRSPYFIFERSGRSKTARTEFTLCDNWLAPSNPNLTVRKKTKENKSKYLKSCQYSWYMRNFHSRQIQIQLFEKKKKQLRFVSCEKRKHICHSQFTRLNSLPLLSGSHLRSRATVKDGRGGVGEEEEGKINKLIQYNHWQ